MSITWRRQERMLSSYGASSFDNSSEVISLRFFHGWQSFEQVVHHLSAGVQAVRTGRDLRRTSVEELTQEERAVEHQALQMSMANIGRALPAICHSGRSDPGLNNASSRLPPQLLRLGVPRLGY
ncbi:hypothetical protein CNMCM5623_000879 [Aspergillus felis]|uniref:Uncharacterized protein n=1 Tax=Aspergillus felis TaxID=1287682 RepID=A0A8H6Q740_9EURO|nr:hypothetical protein CNMCM5623_000879 [Aspergillus felis]